MLAEARSENIRFALVNPDDILAKAQQNSGQIGQADTGKAKPAATPAEIRQQKVSEYLAQNALHSPVVSRAGAVVPDIHEPPRRLPNLIHILDSSDSDSQPSEDELLKQIGFTPPKLDLGQDWSKPKQQPVPEPTIQPNDTTQPPPAHDIFASPTELQAAITVNRDSATIEDKLLPSLLSHGLRFCPATDTADVFRTVIVTNLPAIITPTDLFDTIRCGAVISLQLVDTTSITHSFSALITFAAAHSARAYLTATARMSPTFANRRAHVQSVRTPTYPPSALLAAGIANGTVTRCLSVSHLPASVCLSRLRNDLALRGTAHSVIEHLSFDVAAATLTLRFTSVFAAEWAFGVFARYPQYRGCRPGWAADPCSVPVADGPTADGPVVGS
jgi:hypothetical protein